MGTTFTSLAHGLQQAANGSFGRLGHVHQVLVAALGYNTFAAFKASSEEQPLYDGAQHVVVARNLVEVRLRDLGYSALPQVTDAVIAAIKATFERQVPGVEVHESIGELGSSLHSVVEEAIQDSDDCNTE